MSNILGPPVGYIDMLRDHLVEKSKNELKMVKETGGTRNPLRPSSSGKCERQLAYELMEYTQQAYYEKDPLTAESSLIFDLGHSVEFHLLKNFRNVELIKVAYQQQSLLFFPIEATNPRIRTYIEGSTDAGFIGVNHDWKCLIDVKSKKDKFDAAMKSNWDATDEKLRGMDSVVEVNPGTSVYWVEDLPAFLEELNDPFFQQNFVQLNMYANSDFMRTKGFDHCAIIQYNKNDSRLREVRFKPSTILYDKVRGRFQSAASAADKGDPQLAKPEFAIGSIACAFCNYKKACWGQETDALKAFFKNLPAKRWPLDLDKIEEESIQDAFISYDEGLPVLSAQEELKEKIIKWMFENKVQKVALKRGGAIYELKVFKNSMNLVRGKI